MRKTLLAAFVSLALISAFPSGAVDPADNFLPTPQSVPCRTGDLVEATQGRVPKADFDSGRAADGYMCNASQVSQVGSQDGGTGGGGGYRVYRYTDVDGHVCAIYDTTLLFPANVYAGGTGLTGVWVLWMNDPDHPGTPVHTASLLTPAMQSPHESLSLNQERGLLGAVFANPLFYHGQFDLYDVSQDCRQPALQSSLPMGVLGHEGSFAPDGNTYYASSLYGHTLTAIDTTIPLVTRILWSSVNWNVHGMNVSDDGNTLYFADKGSTVGGSPSPGLTVLDVSRIQARDLNPQVTQISHITWPHIGTPQTAIPVTIGGHSYLVEIDEFGSGNNVGAARIIDIAPAVPKVVSNIRLAVNNLAYQPAQSGDPNATNSLAGYTGHYCGVPQEVEPGILACTFILSGLRVFDIRDPLSPKEIAYFNRPATVDKPGAGPTPYGKQGSYAMSQPAFDVASHRIWYSDGNSGFYVVQIDAVNDAIWPALPPS